MHAAAAFRMDDHAEMAALMEARRFATLVVSGANGPVAAHVPVLLNRDADGRATSLECHVASSNPVAALAEPQTRALVIVNGADAYVTPSLYLSKQEHGRVVPTWNYMAVEVTGLLSVFRDEPALLAQIERLTDVMEQPTASPWAVKDAPADYVKKLLNAITGLRLDIERIEGVAKLSQNRSKDDRAGVLAGFQHSPDPAAQRLAAEMTRKF